MPSQCKGRCDIKKIVIVRETQSKLMDLQEKLEVCDEAGQTLGYFQPIEGRDTYRDVEVPELSPEAEAEIERQMKEGRFFTTSQVLAHLQSLEQR